MRTTLLAVIGAVLLSACGGVFSRVPASDDSTTKLDERLIGVWVAADAEAALRSPAPEMVVIGRKANSAQTFDVATVRLDKDGKLETTRHDVLTTTIGDRSYGSFRIEDDPVKPPSWSVVRYDVVDADTLRAYGLDEVTVAADVRAKAIGGTVSDGKNPDGRPGDVVVILDASVADLRAYLAKRGDAIYRTAKPLVLRRVRRA